MRNNQVEIFFLKIQRYNVGHSANICVLHSTESIMEPTLIKIQIKNIVCLLDAIMQSDKSGS